jgi:hypothetical protein
LRTGGGSDGRVTIGWDGANTWTRSLHPCAARYAIDATMRPTSASTALRVDGSVV